MKKYAIPFLLIFLLFGCSQQTATRDQLYTDAENVYITIKEATLNNVGLDDAEQVKVDEFQTNFLDNIKHYKSDKELLSEMDVLVFSFLMYRVATGLEDKEAINTYKSRLLDSFDNLEIQFKN